MARPYSKWVWGGAIALCMLSPVTAYSGARKVAKNTVRLKPDTTPGLKPDTTEDHAGADQARPPNVRIASRKASPKSAAFLAPTPYTSCKSSNVFGRRCTMSRNVVS